MGAALATIRQVVGCATAPAIFSGGVLPDSNGMTLITFDNDKKPGDHTEEGVGNRWHVVKEPGGAMGGH
ncbi:MAG: hypothetical protein OEP48_01530 [Betaproteobacteria bacterium]|nr:hypothetical protein [Betaproteobacteria bacterium]MDH3437346.1 hypothetical protein [Betaproteobacteria bacterium]